MTGLFDIGVDEISWRKHHRYPTLVFDHDTSKIVLGTAGKNAAALDRFFDDSPTGGAERIEAVSMDLGPAYAKAVRARAPQAVICFDPFHVVKVAGEALDVVRRQAWQVRPTVPRQEHHPQVQGLPVGAVQEPCRPDRQAGRHPGWPAQTRRGAVAGLSA